MPLELHEVKSGNEYYEFFQCQQFSMQNPPSVATQFFSHPLWDGPTAHEDAETSSMVRSWWSHSSNPASHMLKVIDTDRGNKIVAGGQWFISTAKTERAYRINPYWWAPGEGRDFVTEVFEQWAQMMDGKQPCLQLVILFTHPEFRRRGAASMVIDWGIEMADKIGLDCFVESRDTSLPFYLSKGFTIVEERLVKPELKEEDKSKEWKMMEETMAQTIYLLHRPHKT